MEEGFTIREKLVGFFLLFVIILTLVVLLIIAQGKGWFGIYRTYSIKLEQGYNLQLGSLVKMFNTDIGKVTDMSIQREGGRPIVLVTIKVKKEYADLIRVKSTAEVVTPFPFGSEYIEISPGPPEYPILKQHDTIFFLSKEKPLTESLADLVNEENLQRIQTILTNLAELSDRLKIQEKAWHAAVKHMDQVALALLNSEGTLGDLLMRRDIAMRLKETLDKLDNVLKEVNQFATGLKPTSQNLEVLTRNLNQDVVTLGNILTDLKSGTPEFPKLMKSATEFSEEGTEAMETIKRNPLVRFGAPKQKEGQALHVEPRHVK
jgi:phospholipid/cholesterol/gamma-HCH transport system substrate-binding protein